MADDHRLGNEIGDEHLKDGGDVVGSERMRPSDGCDNFPGAEEIEIFQPPPIRPTTGTCYCDRNIISAQI